MKQETLELIEKIKKDLREVLTEYRYNHSIGVMNKAIELAEIYGEDVDKAAIAGLTHDIAKDMSNEESFEFLMKHGIELDEIQKNNTRLLHGIIGAVIVKEKYGLNKQIQDAIKYHTSTYYDMDTFAKIIYVADKIEETRKASPRMEMWRTVAKEDLDQVIILITDYVLGKIIEEKGVIHPTIVETRNRLILNRNQGQTQDQENENRGANRS